MEHDHNTILNNDVVKLNHEMYFYSIIVEPNHKMSPYNGTTKSIKKQHAQS